MRCHRPVSASWGRQAPVGISAQVGLQVFWRGEGREEAGCSLHVAACRDPQVSCQAAARGFADDVGVWGLRGGADWPSVAGPCVCAHRSLARAASVRVSRVHPCVCSSVRLEADPGFCVGWHTESVLSAITWAVLQPQGLQPTRLLCPWDSPGKNTGVGCHALLQGIFPHPGTEPRPLLQFRQILYRLSNQGILL